MHVGIDVGGTKIELAVFDAGLTKIDSWREATPTGDYARFVGTISKMVTTADRKHGSRATVGIGLPGMIDPHGVTSCPNVPGVAGRYTVKDIEESLGRPVAAGNDARNFALSEANGGTGDGRDRVLGIVLGSGMGGGLCIGGSIYAGANNIAGEWGHMLLPATLQQRYDFPLRPCGCGATACIEQYFSGPGFAWMHEHLTGRKAGVPELTEAMRNGDEAAERVFDAYIDGLATCLSQLLIYYDPDVIVLGGGLSKIPEIIERLPAAFPDVPYSEKEIPDILLAKFGDASGVRGAAILGMRL